MTWNFVIPKDITVFDTLIKFALSNNIIISISELNDIISKNALEVHHDFTFFILVIDINLI